MNTLSRLASLAVLAFLLPAAAQPATPSVAPATNAAVVRTNTAIIPVPRTDDRPKRRFDELSQRVKAAAGSVDLVFLGDSITQGWEVSGSNVWSRYYAHRKPLNLGIGGDRTQHVLWRLDKGHLDGLKPKVVVLMIGTNNSNRDDHTPGEILEGVTAIVNKLRSALPETKILLLGIFPRGATFSDQRGKILQVNQALQKLDDGKSVFFFDFGSQLIQPDGTINRQIMNDYLHLTERGYQIWAAAMEPKLSVLLGDSPVSAPQSAPAK